MKPFFFILLSLLLFVGCTQNNSLGDSRVALASVYNKTLYLDELEGLLPVGQNPSDSILVLNSLVESWIRDALIIHEAEKEISQNLNIDKLVRDYRSTLLLHNYEQFLIETKMDTTVSNVELERFYNSNKGFYQLKDPVVRALFMKIPNGSPRLDEVEQWWKNWSKTDVLKLIDYNDKNGEVYMLNEENWHEIEKISRHLPDSLRNFSLTMENTDIKRADALYKYYLRILEVVEDNEPPPLDYIEEKAKKLILQKRKNELIEQEKNRLYQENKNKSNVKIYSK